ncbi:MAG: hypothetical protein ABIR76_13800 [Polaromonas sp.]
MQRPASIRQWAVSCAPEAHKAATSLSAGADRSANERAQTSSSRSAHASSSFRTRNLPAPGGWGWLAALPAALLGMAVGQMLRGRLNEKHFKRLFFAGLLAIGLYMVIGSAIRWLAR